jgi:ArsR family transcriptional regulator
MEQPRVTEACCEQADTAAAAATASAKAVCCGLPSSIRLPPMQVDRQADLFKALGHPVRLQIVDLLARFGGQVCVCDIERQFTLSQPTISHHLRILRQAGLVDGEQRGLWIYYRLRPQALAELAEWVGAWQRSCEEG